MLKRTFFLLCALLLTLISFSQSLSSKEAMTLIRQNSSAIGIEEQDLAEGIISNAYISAGSGITYVYLQQSYQTLPVFNQLLTLAFKNGKLLSKSGSLINNIGKVVNTTSIYASIAPEKAVHTAIQSKKISGTGSLIPFTLIPGKKYDFGKANITSEDITAELMWVPVETEGMVKLAWQIYLVPKNTSDYWLIRVDALNGAIISENNLTVFCNWDNNKSNHLHRENFVLASKKNKNEKSIQWLQSEAKSTSPSIINGASYRVVPFPAESPRHPGGTHALVSNPWTAAPGNATSLKWHSNGTTDYNYTRGNNVWAQEDADGNNGTGVSPISTTPDPLTFNFTPDFTIAPTITTIAANQQFNTTNLFYWNNVIHDIVYQYGFDEVGGNFQANNQGRGGIGNDYVLADAQDGSGTNNANFATPSDGGSGRMQMYLWNAIPTFTVNSPASIAGQYQAVESNFSTANKLASVGQKTGDLVYYNDQAAGTTHEACAGLPVNSVLGKIALIDRGNCNFTVKVKNAQLGGAIAVVMVNNVQGAPITMGGTDNTITIPAIMISINDGQTLKTRLTQGAVNVTLAQGELSDGAVGTGVISHEFAHGISNRLTGGPSQASCLANAEQMGEGWSDYYGLMITQDWANSTLSSGFLSPRAIGTYVVGQLPNQTGIRTQRYSTDLDINNKVYAPTITTQVHERGELWCATLWDMTWNIIEQTGNINPNIYDANSTAGNSIALRLVTEGMKLQPCSPGFIDGRDAILKADSILFNGAYQCPIREAFRRRGMGLNASQGSSQSVTDQVADYTPYVKVKKTQNTIEATEGQQIVYSTTVSSCSPLTGYVLRDTLPSNVTYVSGGTYDATSRVVSFPVEFTSGQSQTFAYTVSVNTGSYFVSTTLLDEIVSGSTLPSTLTASSTTANTWSVSSTQSQSAPNALFTPNAAIASDQKLETAAFTMGTGTASLQFGHYFNTQSGFDGGIVEASTDNGTTWSDLNNKIILGYTNSILASGSANPLAGRRAWSGNSNGFINSSINLSSYTGQTLKLRFRFGSNNTTAGIGWYVDNIKLIKEPVVNIRTNLFDAAGARVDYSDTVTKIVQTVACTGVAVNAQPVNITACIDSDVSFTVVADGTTPNYQWQVSTDGGNTYSDITGANNATLTLTAVTAGMNNNRYRVIISNACPSTATSTSVILTTSQAPNISQQPADQTLCVGGNANFTATNTGGAGTYQWQVSIDGGLTYTDIPGANNLTYIINNVSAALSGNKYRLTITSCTPTPIFTTPSTLIVSNLASISTQPSNTSACNGSSASISVSAIGSNLTYQWQLSTNGGNTFTNISGATAATLNIANASASMNNYQYQVVVANNCASSVTSNPVILTVSNPATLNAQPQGTIICEGSAATFNVIASGSNITYQWQVSTDGGATFTNITGANAAALSLNNVTASLNNNLYRAVIFSCSPSGLNSDPALLSVKSLPTVTAAPADVTSCTGNNVSFTVGASGTNISYQWQVSADGGTTYTNISGANAATLNINNVTLSMSNNKYRILLSNDCAANINSNAATLTVNDDAVISSQPANAGVCIGSTATFSVVASGPGLGYQWQVSTDGGTSYTDITNQTNAVLDVVNVVATMNNNLYRAIVTSSCSATGNPSNAGLLTVLPEAIVNEAPADANGCTGSSVTFNTQITGSDVNYQWQVSTDGGVNYSNIAGANDNTLTLNNITTDMNNNRYRVVATASPCGVTTTAALLQVLASPSVVISAIPNTSLYPGAAITLTATSTPPSASYNWYKNGTLIPGAITNTLQIGYLDAGSYTAKDLNGCNNISNILNITDSVTQQIYISPNPSDGLFAVQHFDGNTNSIKTIIIFDAKGARVFVKRYTLTSAYEKMNVDIRKLASGGYMLLLLDGNGKKISSSKLIKR